MEIDKVRLRTYRQVWTQERVIYQIERVRLPFPVSFRQAGVFALAVILMVMVSRLPLVGQASPVLRYLLLPGALTWFLTKQRLDGKPPLNWLLSMLRYGMNPKRLNRLRPLPPGAGAPAVPGRDHLPVERMNQRCSSRSSTSSRTWCSTGPVRSGRSTGSSPGTTNT